MYRREVSLDGKPKFLARDTRSPYVDTEIFGKPVTRGYHVVAVYNYDVIGERSATVGITTKE